MRKKNIVIAGAGPGMGNQIAQGIGTILFTSGFSII